MSETPYRDLVLRKYSAACIASLAASFFLSLSLPLPAFAQEHEYVPGEVIVKLKGKSRTLAAQAFVGKAVTEKSMALKGSWSGINMHHFALKAGQSVEATINELRNDPDVEYAEPNYIVRRQSLGAPEGPILSMSEVAASHPGMQGSSSPQTSAPIALQQAWSEITPGKEPPIVAIIDTGVDLGHPVFAETGALWTNAGEIPGNGIDDDGNGYIDDVHGWNFVHQHGHPQDDEGHGTHVAGIVLGATQDLMAVPRGSAQIRLMPLKFLDADGAGTTSSAIQAIYYAVNNGAKILNNSWGGGGYSNALLDAIAYSYDKGRVFVAAAGNAANDNDRAPTFPANYAVPNVISIAATSDLDGWAGFSNFGAQSVHMSSPGVSILSTYPGAAFARLSGTSMATPFVAGVAALIVREQPAMNGYQVRQLIFDGAQPISSLVGKTWTRARLNAYQALTYGKMVSVDPTLPAYDKAALRAPSSTAAPESEMGGCGLVKAVHDARHGNLSGPQKNMAFFALLLLVMAPVLLSVFLRQRSGKGQRRFTRYQIASSVRLQMGDRELVGQVSTISLGGVQLNTDAWLEKGGVVKMSICSPDGRDEIEVEGKIVWSEEQKRYGVAFANAGDSTLSAISRWTQSLLKA